MREIGIGGATYKLVASPLTLFYYKKEFGGDLIGDLAQFDGLEDDATCFNSLIVLQMAWAMVKTEKKGQFIKFEQWLNNLDYVNFGDSDWWYSVIIEAQDGFFRKPKEATEEKVQEER